MYNTIAKVMSFGGLIGAMVALFGFHNAGLCAIGIVISLTGTCVMSGREQ